MTQVNKNEQREEKQRLLGDHLIAKTIHLEFKDDEDEIYTKATPLVEIRNLKEFVFDRLHSYAKHDMLTWHQGREGTLPIDQIIIKAHTYCGCPFGIW